MLPRLLVAAALVGLAFAGCMDDETTDPGQDPVPGSGTAGPLYKGAGTLFAGPALYKDPQNAPHPAFNFPTLAHPAVGPGVPEFWAPIAPTAVPAQVTDLQPVGSAGLRSGAGIAVFGSLVVVPGYGQPSAVVDISDPEAPTILSTFRPQENITNHRGAAFIPYPDGRLAVVISTGAGIDVWDLTDPRDPQPLPPLFPDGGSHKVGVIPGTPIVVNAASDGGASSDPETSPGKNQMWDMSDPANPQALPDFENGYSCHHVYFWNDVEQQKFRGVCAGIQYTQIWDTTDPYNPTVVVSVPFGSGGTPAADQGAVVFPLSLSHYAGLSQDGTILIMGDESGGGGLPPGCTVRADVPGVGAVSMPIGALWFYDVSVETEPQLLGWFSASQHEKLANGGQPATSCTAHHGRLVPVDGRDLLAMSFYGSGVVVVDFTGMRNENVGTATTVAQFAQNSNTWETWYYQGYLFTGDLNRGMDVLTMV
jgi:hypothetical protein